MRWGKAPPRGGDEQPEDGVCGGKDPGWRLVEENSPHPVFDEALVIGTPARLGAKPRLQCGQRAGDVQPGLRHHNRDGRQVRKAEPQAVDPGPADQVADDNEHEAPDNEHHDAEVQQQHGVRQKLVRKRGIHPAVAPRSSRPAAVDLCEGLGVVACIPAEASGAAAVWPFRDPEGKTALSCRRSRTASAPRRTCRVAIMQR